ncbi:MAG: glycosyltransferase family 2 protein [Betaproteobacteria bacterium]
MIVLAWIIWLSLGFLAYHYLVYPLAVILLARNAGKSPAAMDEAHWPRVSLIVAAYNEEKVIGRKVANSLELNYPRDRLEIIVVSDGSNDNTMSIVAGYADRGVISMHEPARRGKTAALNRGVAAANGEIVLFSDANNDYNPEAVRALVRHFSDPTVGGVCGLKRIREAPDRESSAGDSLYWRYESAIKLAESRLGSITNGDGEIFAIRRSLYESMDETVINDDAELTLLMIKRGYRILYETAAESYEYASIEIRDDFFVKVRMVAGGFQTIARHAAFLLPPRSWFTFAFFSHKILRWIAPVFLIAMLLSTLVVSLVSFDPLYCIFLGGQLAFYALATLGWIMRKRPHLPTLLYVPFYFCAMNTAAFFGLMRHLRRTQQVQWRKAKR